MTSNKLAEDALCFVRGDPEIHARFEQYLLHLEEGMPEYGICFRSCDLDSEDAFCPLTKEEYEALKPYEPDLAKGKIPSAIDTDKYMEQMDTYGVPVGFKGPLIEWILR